MRVYLLKYRWIIAQSIVFLFLSLSLIIGNGDYRCIDGSCGLFIGQWHLHDALWHISLAKLGFSSWPPQNPFMAGEVLQGYNSLLDLVLFLMRKVGIEPFFAFFKVLPVLIVSFYILSVNIYLKNLSSLKANILAFFLYFGTSLSYLIPLFHGDGFSYSAIKGFPVVTSLTPSMMMLNMQYGISLSLFLWIFILLRSRFGILQQVILSALIFFIFSFKFYAGVVAGLLFGLHFALQAINKQYRKESFISIASLILGSFLSYLIFYKSNNHLNLPFYFSPFALTRLMIDDPQLFYNHGLTLARYFLQDANIFSKKLILIEIYCIILFILINFGVRIAGLSYLFKKDVNRRGYVSNKLIALVAIFTFIIPVLYVQEGGWYNSLQFLYYGVWFASILTAKICIEFIESGKVYKKAVVMIFIVLSLPNLIDQLRYIKEPQMIISQDELQGLQILKNQPPGVVHINNPFKKNGYIPAIAEKIPYYLDTDQLMVTRANYQNRQEYIEKYRGGSIIMIPADYYYIEKRDEDAPDSLRNLTGHSFETIYDSDRLRIVKRKK